MGIALEDRDAFLLGRTVVVFRVPRSVGTTVIED
jgi:hypothetical protein